MSEKQNIKILKPEIKKLYLDGKDVSNIMNLFPNLNSSTIYHWIKKENWNDLRDSKIARYTKTPEILLNTLDKMIQELDKKISDPVAVAKAADAISKISKSIKSLSKEKDRLSSIIFTIGELGKYMSECENAHLFDEDFRAKFDKLLNGFQNLMLDKYSPKNIS